MGGRRTKWNKRMLGGRLTWRNFFLLGILSPQPTWKENFWRCWRLWTHYSLLFILFSSPSIFCFDGKNIFEHRWYSTMNAFVSCFWLNWFSCWRFFVGVTDFKAICGCNVSLEVFQLSLSLSFRHWCVIISVFLSLIFSTVLNMLFCFELRSPSLSQIHIYCHPL